MCRGPPSLRSTQDVQSPSAAGLVWLPAPHAAAGAAASYPGRHDQQPADPMAAEESLNNRAWPFLQDAPPQPQQMVYDHAHEAANNDSAMPVDVGDGHDPANGGWLLGLRSFLPMAPYGTIAAAPTAGGLSPLHGGASGNAPASQSAQGGPIQWLPGTDQQMQSPSEGMAWSHGDSAPVKATDSPARPAEQTLNWGSQLGAASGNGAASAQLRSPTGRGPDHGRPWGQPEGPQLQPDAEADARGGSGGDGSLVSSATAMQDIRASPVIRALDGWGGTIGCDHLAQPAIQGTCHDRFRNSSTCSASEVQLTTLYAGFSQLALWQRAVVCAGHAWQHPSAGLPAGDGLSAGAAALSWGLPAAPPAQQQPPARKPVGRRSVPNLVQSLTNGQNPRPSRAGACAPANALSAFARPDMPSCDWLTEVVACQQSWCADWHQSCAAVTLRELLL